MKPLFWLAASFSMAALLLISMSYAYDNSWNVSIEMKFNTSGLSYSGFADDETSDGTYYENDLAHYYSCFNTSQNFTSGIAFTGKDFNYVQIENLSSQYRVRLGQSLAGNEFIVPITQHSCYNVDSKISSMPGYINGPFNPFVPEGSYTVALTLRYPGIDFISSGGSGEFSAGDYSMSLEKNETGGVTQIIVEKR